MDKLFLFLLLFALVSCNKDTHYPSFISENDLKIHFDLAKWELYKHNLCSENEVGLYNYKKENTYKLISSELRFKKRSYRRSGDTTTLSFIFVNDKNEYIRPPIGTDYYHTLVFVKKVPIEIKLNDVVHIPFGHQSNYCEPLFIEYLKSNKSILHPWLRKEAQKRDYL